MQSHLSSRMRLPAFHRQRPICAVVISDLHLGGAPPYMMSRPQLLAGFITGLPRRCKLQPDEELELIIAGDFIDFLGIPPYEELTSDAVAAADKLWNTMTTAPWSPIFDALAAHVAARHRLTILIGNHDVEMGFPRVQDALLQRLGAAPHDVLFIDKGQAYRIGRALFEHGNRNDPPNRNDWTGLREMASRQSHNEKKIPHLKCSPGSRFVNRVINPLRTSYPFINLIQPEGELLAYLLVALEPALKWRWEYIVRTLCVWRSSTQATHGEAPADGRYAANVDEVPSDAELEATFGELYRQLHTPPRDSAFADWPPLLEWSSDDGLAARFKNRQTIPSEQLQQIRVALRRILEDDDSQNRLERDGNYYDAAQKLILPRGEIDVVVMGHTHLAREIPIGEDGKYINTGTWIDRMTIDKSALLNGHDAELIALLRGLLEDTRRLSPPTYAELRISKDSPVTAKLKEVSEEIT